MDEPIVVTMVIEDVTEVATVGRYKVCIMENLRDGAGATLLGRSSALHSTKSVRSLCLFSPWENLP